jgi:hypothetical protein
LAWIRFWMLSLPASINHQDKLKYVLGKVLKNSFGDQN